MSTFCVIKNCLKPPAITEKKQGKEVKTFLINYDMLQSLYELGDNE